MPKANNNMHYNMCSYYAYISLQLIILNIFILGHKNRSYFC